MEPFYDGDLKDIWDTDLDPTDSLKISAETDIHDWFLEREVKDSAVILNDKLISDALFNGTVPIKSEHSYSLNSDGDSQPNSPKSLHTKMDDMEDECYPAISLKTATNNLRHNHYSLLLHHANTATIDPKCLTMSSPSMPSSSPSSSSSSPTSSSFSANNAANNSLVNAIFTNSLNSSTYHPTAAHHHNHHNGGNIFAGINKLTTAPITVNLRSLEGHNNNGSGGGGDTCGGTTTFPFATKHLPLHQLQQHHQHQHHHNRQNNNNNNNILPHKLSVFSADNDCHSPMSSSPMSGREGSISPDICSDIEIDETCIKDEPMSPDSSCPPSPNTTGGGDGGMRLTLNMANMAAYTKSDLVFEHKNGCLQLTPASQSLLKSQQVILSTTSNSSSSSPSITNGGTTIAATTAILPKISIKTELKSTGSFAAATAAASSQLKQASNSSKTNNGGVYGLPLTPPSSLPSDDSEGNLTPEHLLSPLSPNNTTIVSITGMANGNGSTTAGGASSTTTTTTASALPALNVAASSSTVGRRSTSSSSSSSSSHCGGGGGGGGGGGNHHHHSHHRGGANTGSSGSTRQPIHTPLISSQPKGSTGTLILTEEEKRTLLAEGYPIPQKLPLTKAEEKSLKKIRRKIKNKISAQESRRKKKEYMDHLERRVEILVNENNDYRKRVESLEDSNANLLSQLQKLQALINKQSSKK